MPTYCYETQDGVVHERVFSLIAKVPREIVLDDGLKACRCYQAERKGTPSRSGWPLTCFASGVHASQAGELKEFLAKKGVPTEVTPDGDPVYRDAAHRRKALKARGLFDRMAFALIPLAATAQAMQ
jgi:hypothetical protein